MDEFEIPQDIAALSDEDLATAVEGAIAASSDLTSKDDADLSDEDVANLEALGAFVTEARAAMAERETAAAERAERLAAARTALSAEEEDPEAAAAEAEAEAAAEAVTASARRKVVKRAAAAAPPADAPPAQPLASLTAAADVPGIPTGQPLEDLSQVAKAAQARFAGMPRTKIGSTFQRYGVATLTKPREDDLTQANYPDGMDLLMAASSEKRLSGGSLVAAGGWCAPSETIYDLFTTATTDGLLDLPEVNVSRGGIRFTKGPEFSDIYDSVGFAQTEAQAIAGTEKDCYDVECPDFDEVRLDAVGVCVRAGILTNSAYPELIRFYLENTLIAHQHKVSTRLLAAMNTIAGAAVSVTNAFPHALSILTALELVAEGERQRYRLSLNETLEVVLPFWMRAAIRADLANRTGVDSTNVTDQQIAAHFSNRKLRVQFLYNYQPLTVLSGEDQVPATNFPTNIEALIYPAGTFVKGTTDVITLDAVYDSTGLETNTYTALFAEEGVLLANVRHTPRRITLPLSVSGLTAAANINQDWGSAGPLNTVPVITVEPAA